MPPLSSRFKPLTKEFLALDNGTKIRFSQATQQQQSQTKSRSQGRVLPQMQQSNGRVDSGGCVCVYVCVCVCVCVCLCVRVRERGRAGARVSLCACALVHVRVYVCFLSHRRVVCADPNACSFTRWQLYTLSSEHRLSKNGLIFVPAWSKCQHRTKIKSIFVNPMLESRWRWVHRVLLGH